MEMEKKEKEKELSKWYNIIKRFHQRFEYRNKIDKKIIPKKEDVHIINTYIRDTIFSKDSENIVNQMIVIKYCYKINHSDIITLNIKYHHYSDLLSS
jgi:hypothetical protein